MRIAALYDIHGNLPALEAVLTEILDTGVDQIIAGGDVLPGPMPNETLERLFNLSVPLQFILGNGETAVLDELGGRDPAVPEYIKPVIRWTAQQLTPNHRRALASWPKKIQLGISGLGELLFCHATPRNENEIFTRLTPQDRLLPIFEPLHVSMVVCGHTHMQFDRTVGTTRVVNAGSVGMPFGEPSANWLLIGPGVQLRHTCYDLARAAQRMRDSGYPQADDFVQNYILNPPPEAKMLELFTRAELR